MSDLTSRLGGWAALFFWAVLAFVVVGAIALALTNDTARDACAVACAPNIPLAAERGYCQCAVPGEGGKVYYVMPKGKP